MDLLYNIVPVVNSLVCTENFIEGRPHKYSYNINNQTKPQIDAGKIEGVTNMFISLIA
jgi:hypothetical protein